VRKIASKVEEEDFAQDLEMVYDRHRDDQGWPI